MQLIVIGVAAFLIWKNWSRIKGLFSSNLGNDQTPYVTPPPPPQEPRPTQMEQDAMAFYRQAGKAASDMLRDKYSAEYDLFVNHWIKEHSNV
jgi:hypothetical protein